MTTEHTPGNVPLNDGLGLLPERANLPPQIGRLLKPGMRFGQPVYSAEQMYAYAAQEVAAERERWKEVLEERGRIHGESSRIYARLASAVRAGADDVVLGQLLRAEVRNRA